MARGRAPLPRPLRALVGTAALVGTVRIIDSVWRRTTGRPTPVTTREDDDARATEPAVVRDRLVYALLLSGALRAARRLGLPKADRRSRA